MIRGRWLLAGRVGAFVVLCGVLTRFWLHLRHPVAVPATHQPAAPSWPPITPAD